MRILITNDDGIHAAGLLALRDAARRLGETRVVAPMAEQSGVSHSISLLHPLRVAPTERGHAVSGAPADCVRLAVREILAYPPDLALSGVNLGANVGQDVFYSGTVAAAMEAALLGIPAVAVSLVHGPRPCFTTAAEIGVEMAERLMELWARSGRKGKRAPVLNVNVPRLARNKIKGVRVTRQSLAGGEEGFVRRKDPRGRHYYWLERMQGGDGSVGDTDVAALAQGYVSLTPLKCDLTDVEMMGRLRGIKMRE